VVAGMQISVVDQEGERSSCGRQAEWSQKESGDEEGGASDSRHDWLHRCSVGGLPRLS
jgi:hypothetical protein